VARLLVYPALVAFAMWSALVALRLIGVLPLWATWPFVHAAPAAFYLFSVGVVFAWRRWKPRYSLRSLMIFVFFAACCEGLYLNRESRWQSDRALQGFSASDFSSGGFSPDGQLLVVGGFRGAAWILDFCTGKILRILRNAHVNRIESCGFSRDGTRVVTKASDGVRIWNPSTGESVFEEAPPILDVYLVPDGSSFPGETRTFRYLFFRKLPSIVIEDEERVDGFMRFGKSVADVTMSVQILAVSPDRNCFLAADDLGGGVFFWKRTRPPGWWGFLSLKEFWFSVAFAVGLVVSLICDRRAFARMDAEAARARGNRSRPEVPPGETRRGE
jgi:hypothetical protein